MCQECGTQSLYINTSNFAQLLGDDICDALVDVNALQVVIVVKVLLQDKENAKLSILSKETGYSVLQIPENKLGCIRGIIQQ